MYKITRHLLAILSAAVLSYGGPAHGQAPAPKRIALLIGNWDYNLNGKFDENPAPSFVKDLHQPCADVKMIEAALKKANFEIHEYCNVKQSDFEKAVGALAPEFANLPKHSVIFVYYAGHGIQIHGNAFTVPVVFQWDHDALNKQSAERQVTFFRKNANEVAALLDKLPQDFGIGIVIALDSCREDPLTEKIGYNEAVSIRTPPNSLVQYATTAGDKTPDGGSAKKRFAYVLADELGKGGDVGTIMAKVNARMWDLFAQGNRDTYAELNTGSAFQALRYTPLKVSEAAPAETLRGPVVRNKIIVRNVYDGVSLDFLWCEGPGGEARFKYASELAKTISERHKEFGVGRIQVKPLPEETNAHGGYNVYRNLMRYDDKDMQGKAIPLEQNKERQILVNIAKAFPDAGFLPQRGVGVGGHPTPNYVSAFICLTAPA